MLKVGYIGLGIMGKSMARNILHGGYPVMVHNRSREAVKELVSEGATEAFSPTEVAANTDVVFTNLPDSPDVLDVVFGERGISEGGKPGLIYVDHSTIKPAVSRQIYEKLAEKGIKSLDAPVSGGDIGAKQGTLTIMVGGDDFILEKVKPILSLCGKTITYVGGPGTGQIAKAANQIMVAAQMVAMAELLIFSQKAGADCKKVVEAIKRGAAQCWTLDVKPQRLFEGNREPGFKAYLQAKDLNIIMETAREYGIPLPSAAIDAQLYNAMLQLGNGQQDNSAIISVIEQLAGVHLNESNH